MKRSYLLILSILISHSSVASTDTTWLNAKWRPCIKDGSTYYSIKTKKVSTWQQQMFYTLSSQLFMEGQFLDEACTIKTGPFTWFDDNGYISRTGTYQEGKALGITYFHKNGKIKTSLSYNASGQATYVNSWDQDGNETFLDTFYNDNYGKDCHRDTAVMKGIISKEDGLWHLQFFKVWSDELIINSFYRERLCKTRVKYYARYHHTILIDSVLYDNAGYRNEEWIFSLKGNLDHKRSFSEGKLSSVLYFHPNGQKNYFIEYDSSMAVIRAMNWNETGSEIEVDSARHLPRPSGNISAWKKKMIQKINDDKTLGRKEKKEFYGSVYINFLIDPEGTVDSVWIYKASTFPAMDSLIRNVCSTERQWLPGTYHGRRQQFRVYYYFSFVAGKLVNYRPYF